MYGTWSNKDHDGTAEPSKYDFNLDGTWAIYRTTTDKEPSGFGEYSITEKWTDDMGNVWYKTTWKGALDSESKYGLTRVSDSGTILEAAFSVTKYPTEINRNTTFLAYS